MTIINAPIIKDEVRERELVRVENKWRNTKSECRNPEVDQIWGPQRHRHIEQHNERPHTQVDTRSSKSRVQDTERNASRCESTTSCNVSSPTERQVAQDGVEINLSGEHFKYGGERQEMLRQTKDCARGTTLHQF